MYKLYGYVYSPIIVKGALMPVFIKNGEFYYQDYNDEDKITEFEKIISKNNGENNFVEMENDISVSIGSNYISITKYYDKITIN